MARCFFPALPCSPPARSVELFDLRLPLLAFIAVAAFATAVMGGVAGIGTAIAMIPIMTFAVGVREAIPIVAIAVTLNNFGRGIATRHHIDWRVVVWFSIGAVPASVLGGVVFANAPADLLARSLGVFLIALVAITSRPLVGSSSMTFLGSCTIARAMETFIRWPWEKPSTLLEAISFISRISSS